VFTHHNDNARTGQNLQEVVLTPGNVASTTFGRVFSIPVDGAVYAQPLYVSHLDIGGQFHNVVFVATQHDSVYAVDADDPAGVMLWKTSFINPSAGITTLSDGDLRGCPDIVPEIGITGTPVIDSSSATLYVVARTKDNGTYRQHLHALDLRTGTDRVPSVEIQASVPGSGDGSVNGQVAFDPLLENQRAALLLVNGLVYIAFASNCDIGAYHGWLLAYDAGTLSQVAVFNPTPDGSAGGMWQSGGGPSADDAGNIFVITGNGTFTAPSGGNGYGDSFLKLSARQLTVSDFFTPYNQADLEAADRDLGSGPPLLLPDQNQGPPHLMVSAGKEGTIYLVDRDNMGQFQNGSDSQIVQSIPGGHPLFGSPAYFNNTVYMFAIRDGLKAYSLTNGQLALSGQSPIIAGYPGATPSISANGGDPSTAIVWALQTDQFETGGPAVLRAYQATNVARELYNSSQNPQDAPGPAVKFTVPTIANGKVYVGTQDRLSVFGLCQ
jgi:hypothetical protein